MARSLEHSVALYDSSRRGRGVGHVQTASFRIISSRPVGKKERNYQLQKKHRTRLRSVRAARIRTTRVVYSMMTIRTSSFWRDLAQEVKLSMHRHHHDSSETTTSKKDTGRYTRCAHREDNGKRKAYPHRKRRLSNGVDFQSGGASQE